MDAMPAHIDLNDVLLRLALAVIAGLLIGYNREEHGKAAGIRTTLLVCLAACVAMIQVNLLLPMAGKQSDSFITNDLFRLPLGILSGMGFIGGGAILRRDNIVIGVTTAATLWFVTVIGLCFGGGQLWLGAIATVLGLIVLWGLKLVEKRLRREHGATLSLDVEGDTLGEDDLRRRLADAGLSVRSSRITLGRGHRAMSFELSHLRHETDTRTPDIVLALAREPGIARLEWHALSH
jgi:putative Mg2+ transporter-C (MgtC) family protein